MRFKAGLIIGGSVGYVLGARAGRPRYEQIKRGAARLKRHPAYHQLVAQFTGLVDLVRNMMAGSLSAGSRRLRHAVDRD